MSVDETRNEPPTTNDAAQAVIDLSGFEDRIVARRDIPERPARFAEFPASLRPELVAALRSRGVERLYSHQAEMFERAAAGENVVITTGTASGKSLAYLLPILQAVLERDATRALMLFPTKALGQDQLRGLIEFLDRVEGNAIQTGVYDGDTPPDERRRIRDRAHLVLTNPDMLNAGWLPNHGKRGFAHLFRNVRYLVVDEMHVYRGAFGSHFANLMRRLQRICRHYGSDPQVLAASATIANPQGLAETLCDRPFSVIDQDGSPSEGKTVYFWQPPLLGTDFRRGVVREMADLLPQLIRQRIKTIAFCRSRKNTEVVLKEARDGLADVDGGHDESHLLAGYRGGYTPKERRQVERDLADDRLIGVVSTNALELGVDIGQLECVVQAGFPGTRASFWQQLGRAGRRKRRSVAVVMLRVDAVDQFIAQDPDWVMRTKVEHAVVDPDNLMIQLAHTRAAAAELPLTLDDVATFPDLGEIVAVLQPQDEVRETYGAWHWHGPPHPAGDFSLRNLDGDRFKIVNRETGTTLTEMDRPQTYHEAHPRAVYLHDGQQYLVEHLDLVGHQVLVRSVEQNFYTEPDIRTTIDVLLLQEQAPIGRVEARFGDVRVEETTVGYKMLEFHNHQNLGYEVLPERLRIELETEGVWFDVPEAVLRYLGESPDDYLKGMVHALVSVARMRTMAESSDLRGSSFHDADEETGRTRTALILHDAHPGGLGFAQKAYELRDKVLPAATELVANCACRYGCPACVGNFKLDRRLVEWGLRSLIEDVAPPDGVVARVAANAGPVELKEKVPFDEVPTRWNEILANLGEIEDAAFLRSVQKVEVRGQRLVIGVASRHVVDMVAGSVAQRRLEMRLADYVVLPPGSRIELVADEDERSDRDRRFHKLRRRYDDLEESRR